jgi:SAM-dependent methyltransferase
MIKTWDALATRIRAQTKAPSAEAVPDISSSAAQDRFLATAAATKAGKRVLEVGTKQAVEGRVSHVHHLFPQVGRDDYMMVDVEPGNDVDVVADLHQLPQDWTNKFDAVLAISVFEHLARPWIAAHEVARVLAPGGFAYVSTHQTFPLHGYPSDYFRFSKEALALIFKDAGMRVVEVGYEHRAKISAPDEFVPLAYQDTWNANWPSYLVVNMFAEKPL